MRLWVVDEMRYGLQPVTRRVWTLRGQKVIARVDPRYQWGYVFGALQVAGGGAEFLYCPTVNLECSRLFLEQIARRDPRAVHVVIWDGEPGCFASLGSIKANPQAAIYPKMSAC